MLGTEDGKRVTNLPEEVEKDEPGGERQDDAHMPLLRHCYQWQPHEKRQEINEESQNNHQRAAPDFALFLKLFL